MQTGKKQKNNTDQSRNTQESKTDDVFLILRQVTADRIDKSEDHRSDTGTDLIQGFGNRKGFSFLGLMGGKGHQRAWFLDGLTDLLGKDKDNR